MDVTKSPVNSTTAIVKIGPTMGLPDALASLGLDPVATLLEAGVDIKLFDNPENIISFNERGRILAFCAEKAQCPHFGLLVGQYADIDSLGPIGILMKCCSDVEEALTNLSQYFHLYIQGSTVIFQIDNEIASLTYHINQHGITGNKQVGAGAIAIIYNVLANLCGNDWHANEIWLMQEPPLFIKPFQKNFKLTPKFNASQNSVFFSSKWLKKPLPVTPLALRSLVQEKIEELENGVDNNFADQIRRFLRQALHNDNCNIEKVAQLFLMHPRTLNRRLAEFGLHYQEIVDEIRYDISRQMLEESKLSVNEIAINLHYSDSRTFTRAFKRWSSCTPASWRTQHKAKKQQY